MYFVLSIVDKADEKFSKLNWKLLYMRMELNHVKRENDSMGNLIWAHQFLGYNISL